MAETSSLADAPELDVSELYVSERGRLGSLIHRIVRNRFATEDLVQDSFVKLLGREASGPVRDGNAYLTRIARNLAIDHRRSGREFVGLEEAGIFDMADPAPSAETRLIDRQALRQTVAILAAMPEKTRRAFEMHRLGGATIVEIGKALGISSAHAGRLVLKGYAHIRDGLRAAGHR